MSVVRPSICSRLSIARFSPLLSVLVSLLSPSCSFCPFPYSYSVELPKTASYWVAASSVWLLWSPLSLPVSLPESRSVLLWLTCGSVRAWPGSGPPLFPPPAPPSPHTLSLWSACPVSPPHLLTRARPLWPFRLGFPVSSSLFAPAPNVLPAPAAMPGPSHVDSAPVSLTCPLSLGPCPSRSLHTAGHRPTPLLREGGGHLPSPGSSWVSEPGSWVCVVGCLRRPRRGSSRAWRCTEAMSPPLGTRHGSGPEGPWSTGWRPTGGKVSGGTVSQSLAGTQHECPPGRGAVGEPGLHPLGPGAAGGAMQGGGGAAGPGPGAPLRFRPEGTGRWCVLVAGEPLPVCLVFFFFYHLWVKEKWDLKKAPKRKPISYYLTSTRNTVSKYHVRCFYISSYWTVIYSQSVCNETFPLCYGSTRVVSLNSRFRNKKNLINILSRLLQFARKCLLFIKLFFEESLPCSWISH